MRQSIRICRETFGWQSALRFMLGVISPGRPQCTNCVTPPDEQARCVWCLMYHSCCTDDMLDDPISLQSVWPISQKDCDDHPTSRSKKTKPTLYDNVLNNVLNTRRRTLATRKTQIMFAFKLLVRQWILYRAPFGLIFRRYLNNNFIFPWCTRLWYVQPVAIILFRFAKASPLLACSVF
jgi:hypothetical protein